jgi:hypothetical protein
VEGCPSSGVMEQSEEGNERQNGNMGPQGLLCFVSARLDIWEGMPPGAVWDVRAMALSVRQRADTQVRGAYHISGRGFAASALSTSFLNCAVFCSIQS